MTYLDYQATTPLAPEALAAMLPLLEGNFANPHSAHAPAAQRRRRWKWRATMSPGCCRRAGR